MTKIIAHRANTNGPNETCENSPDYIEEALSRGYDVELDLWVNEWQECWSGHDLPQYKISLNFLHTHRASLWIHCKNIAAMQYLSQQSLGNEYNYFWHQIDDYTLTSQGFVWVYPGKKLVPNSVAVLPENSMNAYTTEELKQCYAICTDYCSSFNQVK